VEDNGTKKARRTYARGLLLFTTLFVFVIPEVFGEVELARDGGVSMVGNPAL